MNEKIIRKLSELVELASSIERKRSLYRGQASGDWALVSKVARSGARKNPKDESIGYDRAAEIRAFKDFKRHAEPFVDARWHDNLSWLAIAQHHGLPTRLLDCTSSVLVAAYFACEHGMSQVASASKTAWPCIFVFRDIPEASAKVLKQPFSRNEPVCHVDSRVASSRVLAQLGSFIWMADPNKPLPSEYVLSRWLIGDPLKMKYELDKLGINPGSLFPGIDGIAKQIEWRYKRIYGQE